MTAPDEAMTGSNEAALKHYSEKYNDPEGDILLLAEYDGIYLRLPSYLLQARR